MARFLGETEPGRCSRPCLRRAFLLRNEALEEYGVEFILHGNTVLRLAQPSSEHVADLEACGVDELVISMSPVTKIDTAERIEDLVSSLGL